jgi:hypothetical protein
MHRLANKIEREVEILCNKGIQQIYSMKTSAYD